MPLGVSQADNIPEEKESPGKKVVKEESVEVKEVVEAESDHYKVGDEIDAKDAETGAWFEAIIEKITANDDVKGLDNLAYHVKVIIIELTNICNKISFPVRGLWRRTESHSAAATTAG